MANAVITVLEADGTTQTDVTVLDVGRQAAAASKSVALATEDKAVLDLLATAAKQPALGTAGSSSTDVISVQGIASGTALPISAASLPLPSGAATAAKQPALGTAGSSSTDVISVQGIASGTALPVSAASLPLPSGAATAAKQPALGTAGTPSADVITVQGSGSGTAIPVTGTITAVTSLTNALPAGTNAIGKLAANSGVDIGDVDVTSVTPGTAAASLGKAEDAAHASGDTGVFALVVRKDSAASLAGTDGDYTGLQVDANGALRVTGASGATEYTEDAAAAANPVGPAQIFVRTDTLSGSTVSADGDNIAARATSKGELYTHDTDLLAAITSGDVAHDAADSGNPTKIGAVAIAGLSTATLVAAADRTNVYAGLDGALIVHPHGGLSDFTSGVATCTTGGNTSIISALGAGIKFYMTGGMIRNSGGTAGGGVLITDGSGGTTKADVPYTTLGAVFKCDPIGFTANTAVFADPTGTDTVVVTLYGFKSKV